MYLVGNQLLNCIVRSKMSEKFYLNSDFYKISTDINEIQKTFEMIKLTDFTEIVQMERYPSNSTLLSLPLDPPRKRYRELYNKRNKLKTKSEPNLLKEAEPSKSYCGDDESCSSAKELSVHDIDKLESAEEIDLTYRSLPERALPKKISKTSHFYSKLKEGFLYKFGRHKREKEEKLDEESSRVKKPMEPPKSLLPKLLTSGTGNTNDELHRGITILSGKSYYFRNGIYLDDQRSEYQMSCPKTMQSLDKRSEIQTLILPETSMIPIRKDSQVRLKSLKYLPTSTNKSSHAGEFSESQEEGTEAIRSLSVDVASSSLNLSDANSNNFESSTNEDSMVSESNTRDRIDDTDGNSEYYDDDDQYDNDSDEYDDCEQLVESELEDGVATTTVALTGTTTRVSTVLIRSLLGTQSTSHITLLPLPLPALMLSLDQASSASNPSSTSSSGSSYCSILLSPEYLHKRTQSA